MKRAQTKSIIIFSFILLGFFLIVWAAPPQGFAIDVTLNSSNSSSQYGSHDGSNITCFSNQTIQYAGNQSIYNWFYNGTQQSITKINLPFEVNGSEATITRDYSFKNHSFKVTDAEHRTTGCVIGGCYDFDGTLEGVCATPYYDGVGNSSEITLSLWFNSDVDNAADDTIFRYQNILNKQGYVIMYDGASATTDLDVRIGTNDTDYGTDSAGINLDANEWYHIVVSFKPNDNQGIKIWLNATLTYAFATDAEYVLSGTAAASSNDICVGTYRSSDYYGTFDGTIDEVKVFNISLSNQSVAALFNEESGNLPYRTIASPDTTVGDSWICQVIPNDNSTDGTPVNSTGNLIINQDPVWTSVALNSTDMSTNDTNENLTGYSTLGGVATTSIFNWFNNGTSNPLTVLNMPFEPNGTTTLSKDYSQLKNNGAYQATGKSVPTGKIGSAFWGDGNSDYVLIPHDSSLEFISTSAFTFMTWYYVASIGTDPFIAKRNVVGATTYQYYLQTPGDTYTFYDGTAERKFTEAGVEGAWTHVVYWHPGNGSTFLYENGVLKESIAFGISNAANGDDITIGRDGEAGGNYFTGRLDELKIFNTLLSEKQIKAIYDDENNNRPFRTIVSDETTTGEEWVCQVTPNDNSTDGNAVNSTLGSLILSSDSCSLTAGANDEILMSDNCTFQDGSVVSYPGNVTITCDSPGVLLFDNYNISAWNINKVANNNYCTVLRKSPTRFLKRYGSTK